MLHYGVIYAASGLDRATCYGLSKSPSLLQLAVYSSKPCNSTPNLLKYIKGLIIGQSRFDHWVYGS